MRDDLNAITTDVIGAAIAVHRELGPGLLESAYKACLAFELADRGHTIAIEKPLPLVYRGKRLDCGYRLDLMVDDCVVVEVKAVDALLPIHATQLLSYLRLTKCAVGLLINFHVRWLARGGLKRVVNDFPDRPTDP